jgi:hypothetical protein
MKTIDSRPIYRRGLVAGLTLGVILAALLASFWGGPKFRGTGIEESLGRREVARGFFGAAVGLGVGLAIGLGGAALVVALSSSEEREQVRDGAPPAVFPGMFGNPGGDPFQAYKEKIDAEEPATRPDEDTGPLPAKMPESCPHCQKKLEGEELVAFCYHCGGALA